MNKQIVGYFLLISCCIFSCKRNKFEVDVSTVEVEIKIQRFERDFFSADPENLYKTHLNLQEKYGSFYQRYIENISGIGMFNDPAIAYNIKTFITEKYIAEVFDDTEKKFSDDLKDIHDGLTDAFKYCRYYFPEMFIPGIITFVSGFNYSVAVTDSILGIGLDMYLGSDYKNYPKTGFPLYKISTMRREYIVADAMKSWLMTEFFSDESNSTANMLGTMIQNGKIMYLMAAVLPQHTDSLKIGYNEMQLEWCRKNEFNVWAHLIDNELLYSAEPQIITKFFNDAPFTSGLPKESPPKIGVWVGWQIVNSFMENNSGITIPQLMKMENAQEILSKSKYKPKK